MNHQDLTAIVRGCAAAHSDTPPDAIGHDTTFDDLGMDSLACICLIVDVEDATGVQIGCADRIAFERIGDVVAFLADRSLPLAA